MKARGETWKQPHKAGTHLAPPPHDAPSGDRRDAMELSPDENARLCEGCVKCCTYITVEIDPPRAAWEYDQWIWALHHRGIQIYVEVPEAWFVLFETVCEKLNDAGRCSIYGRHPVLCREYDPRTCERRMPSDMLAWFDRGEDLETWLSQHRPGHYRRLMAYRKDSPDGPPVADARKDRAAAAGLIRIGAGGAPAGTAAPAVPLRRRQSAPSPRRRA